MANERQKRRRIDAIFYRGLTLWDGWKAEKGQQPKYNKPNHKEAVEYFTRAANEDHSRAQYYLGIAHMHALGVPRDDHKAMRWFRKSADQGHTDAQYYLGIAYMHALGVRRDDREAVRWFRKSADQGHAGAQNNLGIMYSEGWGVAQKDEEEAIKLFYQAKNTKNNGNEEAAVNLGVMYLQKSELMDNTEKKLQWLEKSHRLLCRYKESSARARYYYFKTLQKDSKEWKKWAEIARDLGSHAAEMAVTRGHSEGYDDYEDYYEDIPNYNTRYCPFHPSHYDHNEIYDQNYGSIEDYDYQARSDYYGMLVDGFDKFIEDPWRLEYFEYVLMSGHILDIEDLETTRRWEKLETAWRSKDLATEKNNKQEGLPNIRKWLESVQSYDDGDDKLEDLRELIDPEADTIEQFFFKQFIKVTQHIVDAKYSGDVERWRRGLNHLERLLRKLCACEKASKNTVVYEYYYALVLLFSNKIHEAEKWFERAIVNSKDSEKGDLYQKILYWRALLHRREEAALGISKEKALDKANGYIRSAAESGFAEAQYEAGLMYNDGIGEEKKPREAERWFLRAAEQGGHFRAAYQLGFMYLHGKDGISRDYRKAKYWFKQALPRSVAEWKKDQKLEFGDFFSENLGYVYINAKSNALDIYEEMVHAMFNLVIIHLCGDDDVVRNFKAAKEWFCRAIMLGDRSITYIKEYASEKKKIKKDIRSKGIEMILRFTNEIGDEVVYKDARRLLGNHKKDALEWILDEAVGKSDDKLRKARDFLRQHIDPMSFSHLLLEHEHLRRLVAPHVDEEKIDKEASVYRYWYALSFLFGNNILKADESFRKAAANIEDDDKRGFRPMIWFWLGCMYLRDDITSTPGLTRKMVFVEAKKCFEYAAEGGLTEAQYEVGLIYLEGIGGGKEPREAKKWFLRAAEQGQLRAAYQLGLMYFLGQGEVSRDYSKAKYWFEKTLMAPNNQTGILDLAALGHIAKYLHSEKPPRAEYLARSVTDRERISAMFHLALIFLHDADIDQNYSKAKEYFDKAASRTEYRNETREGIRLFLKAANVCDNKLMKLLGRCTFRNQNNEDEKVSALEWLLLDAEKDNMKRELLVQYVDFIEKNFDSKDIHEYQRIEWLLKAAEAGNDTTQRTARELLSKYKNTGSIEEFVWHCIWGWLATPERKHAKEQQERLQMLLHPHVDGDIGEEATAYQYYYALSFLFSHDVLEAKKYLDQALNLVKNQRNGKEDELRRKILYWLGHICLRNDEIQETDREIKMEQALVDARCHFVDAGKKASKKGKQRKDGDGRGDAAAASGLAEAQYEAGLMYLNGIGGERKQKEAAEWFYRAVNEKHDSTVSRRAAYQLGLMDFRGQAVYWFRKALPKDLVTKYDQNTTPTFDLIRLGWICKTKAWEFGPLLPKELKGAVWMKFNDVIWKEQADALANLGFIYLDRVDDESEVEDHFKKAEDYFRKAADACHADAMFNLGLMSLKNGDHTKAIEYFEKAWEGDLECDECGPKGRYEHVREQTMNSKAYENSEREVQELAQEVGPGIHHVFRRNVKASEKLYSCNYEDALRIQESDNWWPRYRGNWLALHHLEILYRNGKDKDKERYCREKLQMTGFTMPEYSKRT